MSHPVQPPEQARCLCGAVGISVSGPLTPPDLCHCTACRRQAGHGMAYTSAAPSDVTIRGQEAVRWYQSSAIGHRGFCGICGSAVFFRFDGSERVFMSAGCFDPGVLAPLRSHHFVADKADYYEITDTLPQFEGAPHP